MDDIKVYRVPATIDTALLFQMDVGYELSGGRWRDCNASHKYAREHFAPIEGEAARLIHADWAVWVTRCELRDGVNTVGDGDITKGRKAARQLLASMEVA